MSFLRFIRRRRELANREPIPRAERQHDDRPAFAPPDREPVGGAGKTAFMRREYTRITPPSNIRDWREE